MGPGMLITVGSIIVLILAMFITSFVSYYQRRQAEQQVAIGQMQAEYRRKLMEATFSGQEEERRRLAGDMHDDIGTMLSVTKISLNHLERRLTDDAGVSMGQMSMLVQKTRSMIDETMGNVRRISRNLVPTTLDRFGLVAAFEELIERTSDGNLQLSLECPDTLEKLTTSLELMLYRIAQELVNNAIKHARAQTVLIRIICADDQVRLSVIDDGQGFDLDRVMADRERGLGLRNIESRLSVLHGQIAFDVSPGRGSRIHVQVPLHYQSTLPEPVWPHPGLSRREST
ncbi:MAG: sensor histidine kinase [Bacteroidetes bacterium]|nr:sensor histidine kinase [Fibrella sp.]